MARERGIYLTYSSEYSAPRKLAALGLADCIDIVICAQDVAVQHFKPHPRILEVALQQLGVPPEQSLYVGDRSDVDGTAALRAGIRYVNVDSRNGNDTFVELRRLLESTVENTVLGRKPKPNF